jgi:hypothetical protein
MHMRPRCPELPCRRYEMTVAEFARLGRRGWTQGFHVKMGLRAGKLYRDLYKKAPKQKRTSPAGRNKVSVFPCGILEQAYRELSETHGPSGEAQKAANSGDNRSSVSIST